MGLYLLNIKSSWINEKNTVQIEVGLNRSRIDENKASLIHYRCYYIGLMYGCNCF